MAETYGTETHEHEDEYGEQQHEHDAVSEAPSDYEFSDDSGATADVEHNEEILSSEEKSPRRSPVMPIIAVVGGVIALGGVAWWQFGSHSAVPAPFPGSTPIPIASVPLPLVTSEHKTPGPPPVKVSTESVATLPSTPRVASTSPQMQITDQSSATALPNGSIAPAKNDVPVALSASVPVVPAALAPAVAPVAAPAPAVQPFAIPAVTHPEAAPAAPQAFAIPAAAPVPASTTVAAPATNAADKAQIDALNQHINELQAKLDHVNDQLSQVMNMVAATANTSHASATAQDQSNKVAAELSAQHKLPTRPPSPSRYAAMNIRVNPSAHPDMPSHEDIAMDATQTHHTAKHKKTHTTPAHKPAEPVEARAQEAHPTWVLRAATPGHAWVATSADSHDLKAVQVGDMVTGIGQVTSIHQQGNGWIVQGTRGTIH